MGPELHGIIFGMEVVSHLSLHTYKRGPMITKDLESKQVTHYIIKKMMMNKVEMVIMMMDMEMYLGFGISSHSALCSGT